MPGRSEPRPQRRTGGGPPRALGAGAHGLGQRTGKAVYPGKEGSSSVREGTGGRRQPGGVPRGVMHDVRKPTPGRTPAARTPGGAPKTLPPSDPAARRGPACRRLLALQSFFLHRGRRSLPGSAGTSVQSPRKQANRSGGTRGMVGAPGLTGGADNGLCGDVRPGLKRGGRGRVAAAAFPARSRDSQRPGPGGRRWRLRWPAPYRHHPSRSARSRVPGQLLPWLAGRDAWGVAARDGPGGRLWQGRGWPHATAATWIPGRAPR